MALSLALGGLAAVLALVWVYISWNFDYWKKRGVPFCNPLSLFGDRGGGSIVGTPFWELSTAVYNKYKGKHSFAGTFQARRPVLVVLDPELAKHVLTKEFSSFHSRGQPIDEEGDPLSANLFNLDGPRWKNLRTKLSPVFTSGKLKLMFPLMTEVGDRLDVRLRELADQGNGEVELKDLLLRYSTDVIGSVAFGITCNSLKGEKDAFHSMSRELFNNSFIFFIRFFLVSIHPVFVKLFPFKNVISKASNFFLKLMKDTVEYREKNNVDRNDIVKLMMELRETDRFETDRVNHIEFNHSAMAAQALLFFLAGLDNVSNSVGFALHELALNPELQRKAAAEVKDKVAKHGGMTYEALRDMDLIERITREVLRKWNPIGTLTRESADSFKLPNSDVVIDKGVLVWIPVWQMTHDPQYFPEPNRFDPDRFTEESKQSRHHYAYLPFGEGPRFCIAERFAILEMKLCLASLLQKHVFSVGKKTVVVPRLDKNTFSPMPKDGFWLKVEERF